MGIRDRGFALRRRFVTGLAAIMLAAGCTGGFSGAIAAERGAVRDHVIAAAYARIKDAYLRPVDFHRLGVAALKGLSRVDRGLDAEVEAGVIRLLAIGAVAGEYELPPPDDAAGWAGLTASAVDRARSFSAALREAPSERIYEALFDSMAAELDPYSRYTGAQRASGERAQREGYGGVGITLDFVDGRPLVRDVIAKGPADRAGVRAGDALLTIDGERTTALGDTAIRDRLRGPAGTTVSITVGRGDGSRKTMRVRRERVVPNTVSVRIADRVGVLKLDRFNAATATHLRDAVRTARGHLGSAAAGLVLDLRANPGGLLDQAVAVADLFIPQGRIITTEGRHPDSRQRWDADSEDVADGLPMVVLVDGRSASSAEVVAAALQDSGRAVVVGASSFGKGSVQTVTRLPNDGELFLTWSRIYTPAGYTLHRQGVQPTICTSRGTDSPSELLSDLRDGRTPSAVQLAAWRSRAPDDDVALHQLRDACPWRDHEPEVDLTVATMLLADPALYARAISLSTGHTVAER